MFIFSSQKTKLSVSSITEIDALRNNFADLYLLSIYKPTDSDAL